MDLVEEALERDARTRLVLLDRVKCIWEQAPSDATIDIVTNDGFAPPPGVDTIETTLVEDRFQTPGVLLAVMLHVRFDPKQRLSVLAALTAPRVQIEIASKVVFDDNVGRIIERFSFMSGDRVRILVTPPPLLREIEVNLLGYERPIR